MSESGSVPTASASIALADASLVFFETDVRLPHALTGPGPSGVVVMRSVESDPDAPGLGPASPVFQETHIERDGGSDRLMTVGQWGKIHFSAVFLRSHEQPDMLTCGIAARVRQPAPIALASTYTIHATTSDLRHADESIVEIGIPALGSVLRIEAVAGSRLVLAEAGRSALRLQILPKADDSTNVAGSTSAHTVRWDYRLQLVKTDHVV